MTPIPEDRLAQIGDPIIPQHAAMPTFEEAQAMAREISESRERAEWWVKVAPLYVGAAVAAAIVVLVAM